MRDIHGLHSLKKLLLVSTLALLSLVGGYYLVRHIDWTALGNISHWLMGLLLVISTLYLLLYVLGVWVLLRGMGYSPHFGRLCLAVTSSMSTNYLTPVKAGTPVRLWLYKSLLGIPVSSGSASLVIESTLGLLVGIILSLLGAQSVLQRYDIRPYLILLSILATCAAVLLFLRPQLLESFASKFPPSRYIARIVNWGKQFLTSLRTVPKRTLGGVTLLYLVRLTIRALCLYLVLRDAGVSSSLLDLIVVQSISGVIGIISMLPAGIGAKDASLAMLMVQIGVPPNIALIATLIDRLLWTVVPLGIGIISASVLGVNRLIGQESKKSFRDSE